MLGCKKQTRMLYLEAEETGQEPSPFCTSQEGWRKGSAEKDAFQVANGFLVLKIHQQQSSPQGMASLDIGRFSFTWGRHLKFVKGKIKTVLQKLSYAWIALL